MSETNASSQSSSFVAKGLPILLPVLAIIVVGFLGYRWYSLRTDQKINTPEIPTKIEIESLKPEEQTKLQNMARGIGDYKTTKLGQVKPGLGTAEVRYEVKDGKMYASVLTTLPLLKNSAENYQVWLKASQEANWQESSFLEENKAGLMSTFVIPEDKLPVEVKITHEGLVGQDSTAELILFQGQVNK